MARRTRLSPTRHARRFNKLRTKTKAINSPSVVLRGGIRL